MTGEEPVLSGTKHGMVGKVPMEREDGVPSRKEYEYGSWYLHCLEVVEEGLYQLKGNLLLVKLGQRVLCGEAVS